MPRTVKFDALRVAEIKVSLIEAPVTIEAKAAFINTETGATHGWTTGRAGWSDATIEKLKELRESMEADLARIHFVDGATVTPTTSSGDIREGFQGLGEHLGSTEDPTPQG